jgi:hypothetical protein
VGPPSTKAVAPHGKIAANAEMAMADHMTPLELIASRPS